MNLVLLRRLILPVILSFFMLSGAVYAQKAFERKDLASNVARFDTTLREASQQSDRTRPTAQLRKEMASAKAREDLARAYELSSAILLREPASTSDWLAYARMVSAFETDDYDERILWRDYAQNAAYAAYQRATKPADKAAALVVLAEVQAKYELYRQAMESYKAALALNDTPKVRAAYEELRAQYGFRILSNAIDSDAATPRACFQFSERVADGVDFTPYITVSGASNAAVTADDMQICVDGLKHGERYSLGVRQGLPSSTGDSLLRNANYEIYVRDRAPSVRFTGRNYVLPSTGQEGIPLVSVNTGSAEIEIFRIGDRNLLGTVREGGFLDQLGRWVIETLKTERGEKIWNGTLKTASPLNKDEITSFPVHEAVGQKLKPGIYVMTARPEGSVLADEDYGERATQWFVVSDLGLTALSNDGGLRLIVRSLATAKPLQNIELRLMARNNEELAVSRTNAQGEVAFDPGLSRGQGGARPGLVIATTAEGDYNFLDLEQAPFDLTDRGVAGRPAPGPLDGQVFTERGVYRTGESVFVTTLLRDASGNAMSNLPLTLIARRPDGVEYKRAIVNDQGLGGRVWSLPLLAGAAHGTWRVQAYLDSKGEPIGEATFLVEDYMPERIEVKLTPESKTVTLGDVAKIDVNAKFLYGAPGAGLNVTGEVAVAQADHTAIPGLEGFRTGLDDEFFGGVSLELAEGAVTDAHGNARVNVQLPDVSTLRPIEARIALRVAEAGGRAVERSVTLPILPSQPVIGVKPLFSALADGSQAEFEVVEVTPQGVRQAGKVRWILSRIEENYQWYNRGGSWSFETVISTRRVQDGTLDLATEGDLPRISVPVGWGKYRLEVGALEGSVQPVSFTFTSGTSGEASANTPDKLDMLLDKAAYSAGDKMTVTLKPRFAGKVTLVVASDKIYEERNVDVTPEGTSVTLPVKAEWGPGAYIVALAHRPLDVAARRQPGRALGLAWFSVDRQARTLAVSLDVPQTMKPRQKLSVPVKISGLQAGAEAFVTVAAVDVGILNLTRYEPPRPDNYFFGQRQLGTEIRDLYGFLIDGMQGTRGAIRSGGDGGALRLEGSPPSQAPLALYSGVVKVGADGTAKIDFDIPSFNGTVKVFAVAWSKDRVGQASADVIVRDPVVISATMPRFMNVGDGSMLFLAIDNIAGEAADYRLSVDVEGPLQLDKAAMQPIVRLGKGAKTGFAIPVTGQGVGKAKVTIKITGPGVEADQTLQLGVGAGTRPMSRRVVQSLPPKANISVSSDLLTDLMPGTGVVALSVAPMAALDVPALLGALDRYPYGCTEQTVSRALPLIYANTLAKLHALPADIQVETRVNEAIARVLSRQDSTGSFGLWSVGGSDLWLDAFVADFLTRAREHDYDVPQLAFNQTLDRLRNAVANSADFPNGEGEGLAYAAYVLARNGRPIIGDLRYFADVRLASFGSALAQAQIGAGLALLGDRPRADKAMGHATAKLDKEKDTDKGREDFGSVLRDAAGVLALVAETNAGRSNIPRITADLEKARNARKFTSTQENTWLVMAAMGLAEDAKKVSLAVDGVAQTGPVFRTLTGPELATKPLTITNTSDVPVQSVISVAGNPVAAEPAVSQGYDVERTYYRFDGTLVDPATVKQSERLVTVLKVTEREASQAEVLLVDYLPAGFEIDNPSLVDSGDVSALSWLTRDVEPSHTEYRDDRFVAAFHREPDQSAFFSVAYVVRAVSPGRYIHPPAVVEDMYRPDRFGRTGYGRVEVTGVTGAP